MPRQLKRLTARTVSTISATGLHADGDGLYLRVDPGGAKRWVFIFQWLGKRTEMGLGRVAEVGLAEARDLVTAARRQVRDGINPVDARRQALADAARPEIPTFGAFAETVIESIEDGFRNEKHRQQWRNTLRDYAGTIRDKRVDEIGTDDVLTCLKPIWTLKPETASRVRGRIERVLDAAKAKGHRTGENPARWRGHLQNLLPKRLKLSRGHHKALPYSEMPAFMAKLRDATSVSARALEWTILAAARTAETTNARVSEVDRAAKVWTVPANRMKAGREHRVPMSDRMVEIFDAMITIERGGKSKDPYIFPGGGPLRPLSGMAMTMALRQLASDVTVHGFRSAFRDWAGDATSYPREIAEAALAHAVGDETEQAYRRSDALARRRKMMEAWAKYSATPPVKKGSNVLPMARPGIA